MSSPESAEFNYPDNYPEDQAAKLVGIELLEVRPGFAKASMTLQPKHLNGHGTAHGGMVFLLADTVFAYACNSRGVKSVANKCDIIYHLPSHEGDTLTATGEEHYLKGRNGIYDIVITNQHEQIVAHFRGHSTALRT